MPPHSTKKLDLTGQRFGMLTVLAPTDNIGSKTAWRCRCDCGREISVKTYNLRSGRTKCCGCIYGLDLLPDGSSHSNGAAGRASLTYIDGTCVEMVRANTVRRNNTSGVPGVEWRRPKGMWRATICFKGKRYYLGSYRKFEDAVDARKRAEEELVGNFLRELDSGKEKRRTG